VRIPRPRALTAAGVGLALLATSAHATTAGTAGTAGTATPCYYPCTGNNVKVPPTARLRLPNGGPISPSIGQPAGITVLSEIQHAYRHAPGVELDTTPTGATGAPNRRFLLALHNGTVTAEAFSGPRGLALVRRRGGPTYMRAAGAGCWRRLGKESDLTLLNVGAPFPENGKMIGSSSNHLMIETGDGFWGYLASPVMPAQTYYKSFLTVTFNTASHVIRSILVRSPDHAVRATQTVTPLTAAPSMPDQTPTC
jgi:hypothetical protein